MSTRAEEVTRKLRRGLTVEELIGELQELPKDAKVVFVCDYGDHCHTQQALPVEEICELDYGTDCLDTSAYSQSGVRHRTGHDDEEPIFEGDEFYQGKVVILR